MPTDFHTPYFEHTPDWGWQGDTEPIRDDLARFEQLGNDSASKTDWNYWLRNKPGWTPVEAAAIMMGMDPRKIEPSVIEASETQFAETGRAAQFAEYRLFFDRGITMGLLPPIFSPGEAAAFALEYDVAIPAPLHEWLSNSQERLKSFVFLEREVERIKLENAALLAKVQAQPKEKSGKGRTSRSKMITAMSVHGYGHDTRLKRTPATAAIRRACEEVGIKLTDETIKDHLDLAANDCEDDADALKKYLQNRNT